MKLNEIERLLPVVYQRCINPASPMYALLDVMEGLHEPAEQVLERIDSYFDPNTAPESFVRYLAEWVDLSRYLGEEFSGESDITRTFAASVDPERLPNLAASIEPGRLRILIGLAAELSQWRGTARGLKLFLETATGVSGFNIEESINHDGGSLRVFHFRVVAPKAAARHQGLITKIINGEKPAYVSYELVFASVKEGEEQ